MAFSKIQELQDEKKHLEKEGILIITLPETNMFAPEYGWLEYQFPFGMAYFRGDVSFREGKIANFLPTMIGG